jgi:hypothetical protein
VIDNCKITPGQICSNEYLQYSNRITYIQVYCTLQAILLEIDSNKADCFGKFPAYLQYLEAADSANYSAISIASSSNFEAVFFVPASLCLSYKILQPFIALGRTYT